MNARNRAFQCDVNPHEHDALLPREREVLGHWDAGKSRAEIARLTGLAPKTVRDIVIAFDDRPELTPHSNKSLAEDLQHRNDVFVERLLRFFPHVPLGEGEQ